MEAEQQLMEQEEKEQFGLLNEVERKEWREVWLRKKKDEKD